MGVCRKLFKGGNDKNNIIISGSCWGRRDKNIFFFVDFGVFSLGYDNLTNSGGETSTPLSLPAADHICYLILFNNFIFTI